MENVTFLIKLNIYLATSIWPIMAPSRRTHAPSGGHPSAKEVVPVRLENGSPQRRYREAKGQVYVVGALLLTFIVIAAAGVICLIHGEASFRELLIRDRLIE